MPVPAPSTPSPEVEPKEESEQDVAALMASLGLPTSFGAQTTQVRSSSWRSSQDRWTRASSGTGRQGRGTPRSEGRTARPWGAGTQQQGGAVARTRSGGAQPPPAAPTTSSSAGGSPGSAGRGPAHTAGAPTRVQLRAAGAAARIPSAAGEAKAQGWRSSSVAAALAAEGASAASLPSGPPAPPPGFAGRGFDAASVASPGPSAPAPPPGFGAASSESSPYRRSRGASTSGDRPDGSEADVESEATPTSSPQRAWPTAAQRAARAQTAMRGQTGDASQVGNENQVGNESLFSQREEAIRVAAAPDEDVDRADRVAAAIAATALSTPPRASARASAGADAGADGEASATLSAPGAVPPSSAPPRTSPPSTPVSSLPGADAVSSAASPASAQARRQVRVRLPLPAELSRTAARYWLQRYALFSRFDEGILMDEEGWFSATPELIARYHAERAREAAVPGRPSAALDAFAGVGGNTVQLAGVFSRVSAIELSPERMEILKNNARVYGAEANTTFVLGDFFEAAPRIRADAVFLAPPWGGPTYKREVEFDPEALAGGAMRLSDILRICFEKCGVRGAICFLPRNAKLRALADAKPPGVPGPVEVIRTYLNGVFKGVTVLYGVIAKDPRERTGTGVVPAAVRGIGLETKGKKKNKEEGEGEKGEEDDEDEEQDQDEEMAEQRRERRKPSQGRGGAGDGPRGDEEFAADADRAHLEASSRGEAAWGARQGAARTVERRTDRARTSAPEPSRTPPRGGARAGSGGVTRGSVSSGRPVSSGPIPSGSVRDSSSGPPFASPPPGFGVGASLPRAVPAPVVAGAGRGRAAPGAATADDGSTSCSSGLSPTTPTAWRRTHASAPSGVASDDVPSDAVADEAERSQPQDSADETAFAAQTAVGA